MVVGVHKTEFIHSRFPRSDLDHPVCAVGISDGVVYPPDPPRVFWVIIVSMHVIVMSISVWPTRKNEIVR